MAKQNKRSALGRGLSSLIGENAAEATAPDVSSTEADTANTTGESADITNNIQPVDDAGAELAAEDNVQIHGIVEREARAAEEIPISKIEPNPDQPRFLFKQEEIDELATSIEKDGLLQPIVVRRAGDSYQIIAGERRWRACQQLGKATVPVRVVDASDDRAVELALVENVQRADLNPIEEAYGYRRLMERQGMTQSQVAEVVSKGRSTVANVLRLLDLPERAQQLLFEDKITAGHARAILSVPTEEGRARLTEKLANENLSVREAENLARLYSAPAASPEERPARTPAPESFRKAAQELRDKLQTNVRIKTVRGKSRIEIEFADEDELKRLFAQITGE